MPPARFERTAPGLGILCSIHLSYGGTKVFQTLSTPLPSFPYSKCRQLMPYVYMSRLHLTVVGKALIVGHY